MNDNKKPKKLRRDQVKHASLNPKYNSRIRREFLDLDYIDQLDDTIKNCPLPDGSMVTQMEYMSLFMAEWNNAEVGKQSEASNNVFHRTAAEVKDCTDRNNKRNADLFGNLRNKAYKENPKLLNYEALVNAEGENSLENEMSKDINPASVEDAYIDFLEVKELEVMIEEYDLAMKDFQELSEDFIDSQQEGHNRDN
jgi:hypothetical protein